MHSSFSTLSLYFIDASNPLPYMSQAGRKSCLLYCRTYVYPLPPSTVCCSISIWIPTCRSHQHQVSPFFCSTSTQDILRAVLFWPRSGQRRSHSHPPSHGGWSAPTDADQLQSSTNPSTSLRTQDVNRTALSSVIFINSAPSLT